MRSAGSGTRLPASTARACLRVRLAGELIASYSSKEPEEGSDKKDEDKGRDPRVPAEAGMNRFIWDMRYPGARKVPDDKMMEDREFKPLAPPGAYQVRLTVGSASQGEVQTQSFDIVKDPRVEATQGDFDSQFELVTRIRDKLSETHDSIVRLRSVREQVDQWAARAESHSASQTVADAASSLKDKLAEIEGELIQVKYKGARDRLNLPTKLNTKLAEITAIAAAADFAPPTQAYAVYDEVVASIEPQLQRLQTVIDEDVSAFDNLVHELGIPAIVPKDTA